MNMVEIIEIIIDVIGMRYDITPDFVAETNFKLQLNKR